MRSSAIILLSSCCVSSNADMGILERGMGVVGQSSQAMPPETLWCVQSDAQADVQQMLGTRGNSSDSSNARQQAQRKARGVTMIPTFE